MSDDGNTLAILTHDDHVNVYRLSSGNTRPSHSIALTASSSCIALTPDRSLLVAGSSTGLEIVSLTMLVMKQDTSEQVPLKRAIACPQVDSLSLDERGSAILATSLASGSTTVVYPPADDDDENVSRLSIHDKWLTQALHSKSYQKCTHAGFLKPQNDVSAATRAVAFDIPAGAFGILDLQELRFLDSAWSSPSSLAQSRPNLLTTPAPSPDSRIVAVGIKRQGISLYRLRGVKSRGRPIVMPHTREIRLAENVQSLRWTSPSHSHSASSHCLIVASSNTVVPSRPFVDVFDFQDDAPETTGVLDYLTFGYHVSADDAPPVDILLDGVALDTLDDPHSAEFTPFPISEMDADEPRVEAADSVRDSPPRPLSSHPVRAVQPEPIDLQGRFPDQTSGIGPVPSITDKQARPKSGTPATTELNQAAPVVAPDTIPRFTAAHFGDEDMGYIKPQRTFSMRRVFSDSYDSMLATTQRPRSADASKLLGAFDRRSNDQEVIASFADLEPPLTGTSEPRRPLRRRRTSTSAVNRLSTAFDDFSSTTKQWAGTLGSTSRPLSMPLSQSLPASLLPDPSPIGTNAPSADQVASLSRRYTQYVPTPRISNTSVPRAAAGAHRRSSSGYSTNGPSSGRATGFTSQVSLVPSIPEGDEAADTYFAETAIRGRGKQRNSLLAPDGMPRLSTIQSVATLGAKSGSGSADRSETNRNPLDGSQDDVGGSAIPLQAPAGRKEERIPTPPPTRNVQSNKEKRRSRIWPSDVFTKSTKPTKSKSDRKCVVM